MILYGFYGLNHKKQIFKSLIIDYLLISFIKIFSDLVKCNQLLIYFHSLYLPHKSTFGLQVYKISMIQFKVEYGAYTPTMDSFILNISAIHIIYSFKTIPPYLPILEVQQQIKHHPALMVHPLK